MSAPIVYRWDDGNAPVARGERGSLIEILTACLVTGYGEKPAAGWTREFANAELTKAAFRNDAANGTGFFLQVDELGSTTAYTPTLKAFESMTSEESGIGPFATSYGNTFSVSSGANTTARPWVLIADERAFYLFIWVAEAATSTPAGNGQCSVLFFGDLVRYDQNDAFCCGLSSGHYGGAVGGVYSASVGALSGYSGVYMPRAISGAATPIIAGHIRGGGPGVDSGACAAYGVAWSSGSPYLITRPHINNAAAFTMRGWLPGQYYPCHPYSAFANLTPIGSDGRNFLAIRHSTLGGSIACSFISLDDWWA